MAFIAKYPAHFYRLPQKLAIQEICLSRNASTSTITLVEARTELELPPASEDGSMVSRSDTPISLLKDGYLEKSTRNRSVSPARQ